MFASNGDGFVFHDRTGTSAVKEATIGLDNFPSPGDLWARFRAWKGLSPEAEQIVLEDYFDDGSGKAPRYYQVNAINTAMEAIAKGDDRILLVMATGTGKTYTAFQIIWRLWKAGRKKRILFLADRNVLIDQTMVNDFRPFGAAMAKLSTKAGTIERADGTLEDLTGVIDGKRRIDTAYEIYLGLYQAITGPEERQKIFREFSSGFFDLIVIDECHRGSAAEDFRLARNSGVFFVGHADRPDRHAQGNPVRFQHPVLRRAGVHLFPQAGHPRRFSGTLTRSSRSISIATWKATVPRRRNSTATARRSRTASTTSRTSTARWSWTSGAKLVARKITAFLKESGDRFQKAIVFCVDQEHAARVRQALINENADLVKKNHRYVMRITGR